MNAFVVNSFMLKILAVLCYQYCFLVHKVSWGPLMDWTAGSEVHST